MDFIVVAKVAMVAIFPNVASVGVEERVVTPAIRELDTAEVSLRHDGMGLKNWFQCEHCKKQSDDREDHLCIKVNAHVSASNLFSADCGTSQTWHFRGRQHRLVVRPCIPAFSGTWELEHPDGESTAGSHVTEFGHRVRSARQ